MKNISKFLTLCLLSSSFFSNNNANWFTDWFGPREGKTAKILKETKEELNEAREDLEEAEEKIEQAENKIKSLESKKE